MMEFEDPEAYERGSFVREDLWLQMLYRMVEMAASAAGVFLLLQPWWYSSCADSTLMF